jgi:hypothetical protein
MTPALRAPPRAPDHRAAGVEFGDGPGERLLGRCWVRLHEAPPKHVVGTTLEEGEIDSLEDRQRVARYSRRLIRISRRERCPGARDPRHGSIDVRLEDCGDVRQPLRGELGATVTLCAGQLGQFEQQHGGERRSWHRFKPSDGRRQVLKCPFPTLVGVEEGSDAISEGRFRPPFEFHVGLPGEREISARHLWRSRFARCMSGGS